MGQHAPQNRIQHSKTLRIWYIAFDLHYFLVRNEFLWNFHDFLGYFRPQNHETLHKNLFHAKNKWCKSKAIYHILSGFCCFIPFSIEI